MPRWTIRTLSIFGLCGLLVAGYLTLFAPRSAMRAAAQRDDQGSGRLAGLQPTWPDTSLPPPGATISYQLNATPYPVAWTNGVATALKSPFNLGPGVFTLTCYSGPAHAAPLQTPLTFSDTIQVGDGRSSFSCPGAIPSGPKDFTTFIGLTCDSGMPCTLFFVP